MSSKNPDTSRYEVSETVQHSPYRQKSDGDRKRKDQSKSNQDNRKGNSNDENDYNRRESSSQKQYQPAKTSDGSYGQSDKLQNGKTANKQRYRRSLYEQNQSEEEDDDSSSSSENKSDEEDHQSSRKLKNSRQLPKFHERRLPPLPPTPPSPLAADPSTSRFIPPNDGFPPRNRNKNYRPPLPTTLDEVQANY